MTEMFERFTSVRHAETTLMQISAVTALFLVLCLLCRESAQALGTFPRAASLLEQFQASTLRRRLAQGFSVVLVAVALCSSVAYFWGSRNSGDHLQRWDLYHTVIGVKYFPELGYFETYRCSLVADQQGARRFKGAKRVRDLNTRDTLKRKEHLKDENCRARFSEPRWEEFQRDIKTVGTWMGRSTWARIFGDKGFNGTPFYTMIVGVLLQIFGISDRAMVGHAMVDPALMIASFLCVAWAYGVNRAALVAILFCSFFPNRYLHMGGSILRFDYVAAILMGLSALKKERWGLAGFFLAWATLVRIFPLFFAFAVLLKIADETVRTRGLASSHRRFIAWYGGAVLIGVMMSVLSLKGGLQNWLDWAANMRLHNMHSASFRIGFKHLFMSDGAIGTSDYPEMQRIFEARSGSYWVAVVALSAPYLLSIRKHSAAGFAAVYGVLLFFMLTVATRYYYGVIVTLLLVDRNLLKNRYMLIVSALLFYASAFDYGYYRSNRNDAFMYNNVIGLELAGIFVLLGTWMLIDPSLKDGFKRKHQPNR